MLGVGLSADPAASKEENGTQQAQCGTGWLRESLKGQWAGWATRACVFELCRYNETGASAQGIECEIEHVRSRLDIQSG